MKYILSFAFSVLFLALLASGTQQNFTSDAIVTTTTQSTLSSVVEVVEDDVTKDGELCRVTCCAEVEGGMICVTRGSIFRSCEKAYELACGALNDL